MSPLPGVLDALILPVSGSPVLLLPAALALWLAVMGAAWRQTAWTDWWTALPLALLAGALTWLAAWQVLPPGSPPGLAELGYRLDSQRLALAAFGFGLAATAFAWPLLAMRRTTRVTLVA